MKTMIPLLVCWVIPLVSLITMLPMVISCQNHHQKSLVLNHNHFRNNHHPQNHPCPNTTKKPSKPLPKNTLLLLHHHLKANLQIYPLQSHVTCLLKTIPIMMPIFHP
ncbi:hypothetical protein LguiB_028416 [Lonicera macranthoides]